MALSPLLFRAYDLRGILGVHWNIDDAPWLGFAIGDMAKQRGIAALAIGRDGRESSPDLAHGLKLGLNLAGIEVFDIGEVPSPFCYFAATGALQDSQGRPVLSSLSITASHNPKEYNGIKLVFHRQSLTDEEIQQLGEFCLNPDHHARFHKLFDERENQKSQQAPIATCHYRDLAEDYTAAIAKSLQRIETPLQKLAQKRDGGKGKKRRLKVAIDAGNAVPGSFAPGILAGLLPVDLTLLHCQPDHHFPNHHPDPSKAENLRDLCHCVTENALDLGLAFDGDGDRLGVVDERGVPVPADALLAILAEDVLSIEGEGNIFFDIKCSNRLPKQIQSLGGHPVEIRTGHSFIKKALHEQQGLLAGEMSGHIFYGTPWFGYDDAIYAAARLLSSLSWRSQPLSEWIQPLIGRYRPEPLEISIDDQLKFPLIQQLQKEAPAKCRQLFGDVKINLVDGLRIDVLPHDPEHALAWWGLIRASNTSANLSVACEANSLQQLQEVINLLNRLLADAYAQLELPKGVQDLAVPTISTSVIEQFK